MLRLRDREFDPSSRLIMGIVNATPDSFYDAGKAFGLDAALRVVDDFVEQGADMVDIGGVRAGVGREVDEAEEIRRTAPLIAAVRERHPDLLISIDTWRAAVAKVAVAEGADLINDAWAGYDPELAVVAAESDAALLCSHTGGLEPRTFSRRPRYDNLVEDVADSLRRLALRAVDLGVAEDRIVVDPAHDFGKNTWHGLILTKRLNELVALGWPVLVAISNKDWIGESLDLPKQERLEGTMAALSICAWHGAMIFRVHNVRQARRTVDMVSTIMGLREPARAIRHLT